MYGALRLFCNYMMIRISLRVYCFPIVALLASFFAFTGLCGAENIYVAQYASGNVTGSSCANAYPVSWFNTPGNWGSGANKIGAGDTVRLCGTIQFTGGASGLTFRGSGLAGSPITLVFEKDAVLESAYFAGGNIAAGAIVINGANFITIDGGSNGIIRNTANGTALANQQASNAISITTANHIEVKNLNILNLFLRTSTTGAQPAVFAFNLWNAHSSNISIHHNTVTWAYTALQAVYPGGKICADWRFYNNTITNSGSCVILGHGDTNAVLKGLLIYNNSCGGGVDWWDAANVYHMNHLHIWASASGASITGMKIYGNYFYGDFGYLLEPGHQTGSIFIQSGNGGSIAATEIYNNLLTQPYHPSNGYICLAGAAGGTISGVAIYNNTLAGAGAGNAIELYYGVRDVDIKNNIFYNVDHYIYTTGGVTIAGSNYNLYFGGTSKFNHGGNRYNLKAWKAAGYDTNSRGEADPKFRSATDFRLQGSSPAKWAGTSTGQLSATDKAGVRWHTPPSIGAYEINAQ